MRTKIANLEVFIIEGDTAEDRKEQQRPPGSSFYFKDDPMKMRLNLAPMEDRAGLIKAGIKSDNPKEAVQTIVAHELGHFVAAITKDATHEKLFRFMLGPLPAENKAWEIAENILPDLDQRLKRKVMLQNELVELVSQIGADEAIRRLKQEQEPAYEKEKEGSRQAQAPLY